MKTIRDALCLLALAAGLLAARSPAWSQPLLPEQGSQPVEVQGFGPTVRDAERDAVERACTRFQEYLTEKYPALVWKVDPGYLWKRGLVQLKNDPVEKTLERIGKVQQVSLVVNLGSEDPREIDSLNREQLTKERTVRSLDRHRLTALVLAGLVAGLVVLKLYLWLEEATRGYSSGLLRLAALVVLGLVIAVLLWIA